MLIKRLAKFWRYNDWAWEHIYKSVKQLEDNELRKERGFFWGSIYGTLAHCIAAEIIWIERLHGKSPERLLGVADFPTLEDLIQARKDVQARWVKYVDQLTEEDVMQTITFTSTEGLVRQHLIADIIQHISNHSTEHRSQISPVLFELGVPTDELDFIYYCMFHEPT